MTVFNWNADTERRIHRGMTPTMSRISALAGPDALNEAVQSTVSDMQDDIKKTIMEKVAISTGVSVGIMVVSNCFPVIGQIVSAVYAVVSAIVGKIYERKLSEHLDDFKSWINDRVAESQVTIDGIRNNAFTKARNTAIPLYNSAKASGITTSAQLAKTSAWWQDTVAKYNKNPSSYPAPGLGELFPTGKSGFAWIGDEELLHDHIRSPHYVGHAHIVDGLGKYHGTVWYDGRMLYRNGGLGLDLVQEWRNGYDSVMDVIRTISDQAVSLVPKLTQLNPVVAAVKYIVAPAMTEIGWGGTAQKLENGVTTAGNVMSSAIVGGAMMAIPVTGPTQGMALMAGSAVEAMKEPLTDALTSVGAKNLADKTEAFMDKTAAKGEQIARDPGVVVKDATTVMDTLTGKETVNKADEEIAKGKVKILGALAAQVHEADLQMNSEAYQKTLSGFLVAKMLDDPKFAAQIFKLNGQTIPVTMPSADPVTINQQAGLSNAGTFLPMLAAAAGGLFLLKK
jgi:hypothetical protein